ncbi:MAG: site-specific integrase [Clostridiales bacterium]|nr:site-specific integrase [Clostridiales bacterium]
MSVKRRDHKGRVLRDRESQNKDGRYVYTYSVNGTKKKLYSWKLEPTDKLPPGKRDCISLREQIAELSQLSFLGIQNTNVTVIELVEKYLKTRRDVKASTRMNYNTVKNFLSKDSFGQMRIKDIKVSDAKIWLIKLQDVDGKSYSGIHAIRGVLRPAFQMAVDDDILPKNPFNFKLASVIVNDSVTREALSRKQERDFLEFVKNDNYFNRYYDGIYLLFKTGMRISEFCGLTIRDINLKERTINIDHQLIRVSMDCLIEETKTEAGARTLPMTDDVYECCKRLLSNRSSPKIEPMIDGYSGFLFLDRNNKPMVAMHWEKYFQRIVAKYNNIYKVQMPKVTPHVCRHTYCSNMAKSGMNPKTLQYLMGHSDIGVTLNTYTHLGYEDAKEELKKFTKSRRKSV